MGTNKNVLQVDIIFSDNATRFFTKMNALFFGDTADTSNYSASRYRFKVTMTMKE
jgi:hypothetical protein